MENYTELNNIKSLLKSNDFENIKLGLDLIYVNENLYNKIKDLATTMLKTEGRIYYSMKYEILYQQILEDPEYYTSGFVDSFLNLIIYQLNVLINFCKV